MDAEPSLVLLTEFLLKNPAVHIQINGHTDNIGNESDNTMLSTQRAKSVVDYLIAKGIDSKTFGVD